MGSCIKNSSQNLNSADPVPTFHTPFCSVSKVTLRNTCVITFFILVLARHNLFQAFENWWLIAKNVITGSLLSICYKLVAIWYLAVKSSNIKNNKERKGKCWPQGCIFGGGKKKSINVTFLKDYTLELFKQLTNRMIRATICSLCLLEQH